MPAGERREYAGNAPPTSLSNGIDNTTLTIPLTNATSYPTGVTGPFFIVIDRGLTTEEKIKCASRTGNVCTAIAGGRGVDGTTASSHSSGAVVEHVFTADDANLANVHYADTTLDNHTQYLNNARHDVTTRHGTSVLDMAALTLALIPPGVMWDYGGAAAPSGWLLCDGSAVSRTTFSALFTAIGTTFGAGDGSTTFNLPDARTRTLVGSSAQNAVGAGVVANVALGAGLTARARGAATGSESQSITLAIANMPTHSHTQNAHTHGFSTGTESNYHTHNMESHAHDINHDHQTIRNSDLAGIISSPSGPYNINGSGSTWVTIDSGHTERTSGPSTTTSGTPGWYGGATNNNQLHTHSGTTGTQSDTATANQGSGTAFTVNTIDPILAVTKIIKT